MYEVREIHLEIHKICHKMAYFGQKREKIASNRANYAHFEHNLPENRKKWIFWDFIQIKLEISKFQTKIAQNGLF